MLRFTILSWVCDYDIWDHKIKRFLGVPFESYSDAKIVCDWLNRLDEKEAVNA